MSVLAAAQKVLYTLTSYSYELLIAVSAGICFAFGNAAAQLPHIARRSIAGFVLPTILEVKPVSSAAC